MPVTSLLVLLAEYSRYLTASQAGAAIFAPRNLLAVGLVTLLVWVGLRLKLPTWRLLVIPGLLLIWIVASKFWSDYPGATPITLEWAYGVTLALLVGLAARPVFGSKWFGSALLVAVLGIVAVGLVEKITDTHLPLSNLHNPYRQQWAITSVFIGQNHLAASLGLLLPLLTGFGLAWHGWRRWLSLVTVALGLVAVFFTGSTLTLAALVLAGLVFAAVAIYKAQPKKRTRVALAVLGAGVLILLGWLMMPASIQERVSVATLGVRQSFDTRIELARQGVSLIKEAPLQGLGPGATGERIAVTLNNQPTVRALHNLSLEFAVTYGLAAAILAMVWLVWVVAQVARRLSGPGQRWPTAGVLASLAALAIIQAVPSTFEGVRAPFIVVGFALALALRQRPKA